MRNRSLSFCPAYRGACATGVLLFLLGTFSNSALAHPDIEVQIAEQTKLLEADPQNAKAYVRRGELHRIHQDWPAAFADYENAEAVDPQLADVQFCRGRALAEAGRAVEAIPILERYLAAHDDVAEAHSSYARALLQLGRTENAAAAFEKGVSKRPSPRPEDYLELAGTLQKLQTSDGDTRALETLNRGMKQLGSVPSLELSALELEIKDKQTTPALTRLDRLIAASPRPESWLVRKGDLLVELERRHPARVAYLAALKAISTLPDSRRETPATREIATQAERGLGQTSAAAKAGATQTSGSAISPELF